jgi:hypothetical protein
MPGLHNSAAGGACQGRIKGFVGHRHFTSPGPFGDSTSIVETTEYSRLSGLMEEDGMHG